MRPPSRSGSAGGIRTRWQPNATGGNRQQPTTPQDYPAWLDTDGNPINAHDGRMHIPYLERWSLE
jgi:hypothetical protein